MTEKCIKNATSASKMQHHCIINATYLQRLQHGCNINASYLQPVQHECDKNATSATWLQHECDTIATWLKGGETMDQALLLDNLFQIKNNLSGENLAAMDEAISILQSTFDKQTVSKTTEIKSRVEGEVDIQKIYEEVKQGQSINYLAKKYNIHRSTIYRKKRRYENMIAKKHIEDDLPGIE